MPPEVPQLRGGAAGAGGQEQGQGQEGGLSGEQVQGAGDKGLLAQGRRQLQVQVQEGLRGEVLRER